MTTASWSSRIRHDSDATYQEWRDELITKLGVLVAGGVLSADETNITPGAGARPGTNTEGGYAVYHLNDSLHGTAPVYIRFGFGTASATTAPRLQVTVGTSTNGSGVLGGTALSAATVCHVAATQVTDTGRQSYLSCTAGFLGLDWKVGSTMNGTFFICRTVDSDGAITATGAIAHWGVSNSTTITQRQAYRYAATAAAYTADNGIVQRMLGFAPQTPASSSFGGNIQVYVAWTGAPTMTPVIGVCGVFLSELAAGGTFTATPVGSTARTYLTMNGQSGPFGPIAGTGQIGIAMLWE